MSPLDKEAPQLRGMDGEGSVQVHQDAGVSIDAVSYTHLRAHET